MTVERHIDVRDYVTDIGRPISPVVSQHDISTDTDQLTTLHTTRALLQSVFYTAQHERGF